MHYPVQSICYHNSKAGFQTWIKQQRESPWSGSGDYDPFIFALMAFMISRLSSR
jgi:hypothetical protein